MIGVATVLVMVLLAVIVTRIATVALRATGLSHEAAQFQARSAFTGVGFTTNESEDIVNHPVRRRIVLMLMLLSSAGVVTALASLMVSFGNTTGYRQVLARVGALVIGLTLVCILAASDRVERRVSRLIERALSRWTTLDTRDYVQLLRVSGDYSIAEIEVGLDEWLAGRAVHDVLLSQEGIVVLGIYRADGSYLGAPPVGASIEAGDVVVVYGRSPVLEELHDRRADVAGDRAHHRTVIKQELLTHGAILRGAHRSKY